MAKIRRAAENEDLTPYVALWNLNYPLASFTMSQTKVHQSHLEAASETIRWGAWEGEELAAYIKVIFCTTPDGCPGADVTQCSIPGCPHHILQALLRTVIAEMTERETMRAVLWEQAGHSRDVVWMMNGFRHTISLPILSLHVELANQHLMQDLQADSVAAGITYLTAEQCREKSIDWVAPAAEAAADIDSKFTILGRTRKDLLDGYMNLFSAYDADDLKSLLLAWSGKEIVGIVVGRTDLTTGKRVLQNLIGCRGYHAKTGLHLALQAKFVELAEARGCTEVVVEGEFEPHEIEDWMKLGFEIQSMWRRYTRVFENVKVA